MNGLELSVIYNIARDGTERTTKGEKNSISGKFYNSNLSYQKTHNLFFFS